MTSLAGLDGSGCETGGVIGRALGGVRGGVVLVASLIGFSVSLTTGRLMPDPLRS